MNYYLDLFSPETYEAFTQSSLDISGFRYIHSCLSEWPSPVLTVELIMY
jgi:hypothetical protein